MPQAGGSQVPLVPVIRLHRVRLKTRSPVPSAAGVAGRTGNGLGWQSGTGQPQSVPLEALRLDPALRIGPIKHCQVAHTLKCSSLSLIAVTMCLNSWYCKNMWIILFLHIFSDIICTSFVSQIFANPWLRIHDWQPHQWDLSRPTRCTTASSARLALRSKNFTISGKQHRLLNVIVCYKQRICHLCGLIWLKFARFDMYLQVKPTYTILFESWDSLLKDPSVQEYTPCYKW